MDTTQTEKETKLMTINAELLAACVLAFDAFDDMSNPWEYDTERSYLRHVIARARGFNHAQ